MKFIYLRELAFSFVLVTLVFYVVLNGFDISIYEVTVSKGFQQAKKREWDLNNNF